MIVCTKETGIRDVASELRIWPPIWKAVRGSVVRIRSLDGFRIPLRSAGMAVFKAGYTLANHANTKHHDETKANCMRVRVTGFGKALRIALEEVFDIADVVYQIAHNIWHRSVSLRFSVFDRVYPTISFGDIGAFRASAISCAFCVTLP